MSEEKFEKLSDEELEIVAGGSKKESNEIRALYNQAKKLKRQGFNSVGEFLTYAGIRANMNDEKDHIYVNPYGDCYVDRPAKQNEYFIISTGLGRSHRETVAILKEFYALD